MDTYEVSVCFDGEHPIIENRLIKKAASLNGDELGSGYNIEKKIRDISFEFANLDDAKQFCKEPVSKSITYDFIKILGDYLRGEI